MISRLASKSRYIWISSFLLSCTLIVSLFATDYYFNIAKVGFYLALIIALLAVTLEWYKAFKIRGKQFIMAVFLSILFVIYYFMIATFYIASYSGV